MTWALSLDRRDKTDFSRFARAHPFYTDVIGFDYLLPNDILEKLGAGGMQLIAAVLSSGYDAAREILRNDARRLATDQEAALLGMLSALSLAPKNFRSHIGDREYEAFKNNKPRLENLRRQYLAASDSPPEYFYNFALLYLKIGEVEEAVKLLETALLKNPAFKKPHVPLALIHTVIENWRKGLEHGAAAKAAGLETVAANLIKTCLIACSLNLEEPEKPWVDTRGLDIEAALSYFPGIEGETDHSGHDRIIVMAACDSRYLKKHVAALAASLEEHDPNSALHIHLTNPDDESRLLLEDLRRNLRQIRILVSTDRADFAKYMSDIYYLSAPRDVRLYQLMKRNPHRFIRIDADSLVVRKIDENSGLFARDIVLPFSYRIHMPYWERILNGLKSVRRSETSLKFIEELCLLIYKNFREKTHLWFMDQVYVTWLYEKHKENFKIGLADIDRCLDLRHSKESYIWTVAHAKAGTAAYLVEKLRLLRKYDLEKYQ